MSATATTEITELEQS